MIDSLLNFQLSFFGAFESIKPNSDTIFDLMELYKREGLRFIPSTITITKINVLNNNILPEDRLKMVREDKKWEIVFMPDRIDANYINSDTNDLVTYDSLFETGYDMLSFVFDNLGLSAKRLSVNGQLLFKKLSLDEIGDYRKRFLNIPKVFDEKRLQEWSFSVNSLSECDFQKKEIEDINVINNLSLGRSQNSDDPYRIILGFDINTLQENIEDRFKSSDLKTFTDNSKKIFTSILSFYEVEYEDDGNATNS